MIQINEDQLTRIAELYDVCEGLCDGFKEDYLRAQNANNTKEAERAYQYSSICHAREFGYDNILQILGLRVTKDVQGNHKIIKK